MASRNQRDISRTSIIEIEKPDPTYDALKQSELLVLPLPGIVAPATDGRGFPRVGVAVDLLEVEGGKDGGVEWFGPGHRLHAEGDMGEEGFAGGCRGYGIRCHSGEIRYLPGTSSERGKLV